MDFNFLSTPRIVCESGGLGRIGSLMQDLSCTRALVVTDPGILACGFADEAAASLRAAGIEVEIFHKVEADPPIAVVEAAVEVARAFGADGIIGLGGIGSTLAGMVGSFRMNPVIAHDPLISEERAQEIGVTLVTLDELMRASDFVSVNCPLLDQTRNLVSDRELGLMKPTAYLINTARGGIVNETALLSALQANQIAGAALDCHETEPVPADYAFAELDNVIMAPHSVAWTNELFRDLGRMACSQAIELANGNVPHGVVNKEVVDRPGFQAKLARYSK